MQYVKSRLIFEARKPKISKIKLDGIYYHGSVLQKYDDIFTPSADYNDFGAFWCCDDENISEEFSDNWYNDEDVNNVKIIYKLEVKSKKIADLSFDKYEELIKYLGESDLRECIPYLKDLGFDGWLTVASIGRTIYDDVALFNDDIYKVLSVKLYLNKEWSDYLSLDEAEKLLRNHREKLDGHQNVINESIIKNTKRDILFEDEYGKQIVYDDDLYRIVIDDKNDARHITLWFLNKNKWTKVGVLDAYLNNMNYKDRHGKYLSINLINIEPKHRNKGYSKLMYRALIDFSANDIKGIYSYLPNRSNKKQVPHIYKQLHAITDGDYQFIDFK